MKRSVMLTVAVAALTAVAVIYSVVVTRPRPVGNSDTSVDSGQILFRDGSGQVAMVPRTDPGGARVISDTSCQRFATSGSVAVCLQTRPGLVSTTNAVILDNRLRETRRVELAGVPSRARVSASGRMVSWTVFVSGDSYNVGGFSTWTGLLDTGTGYLIVNMENIQLYKDGERYHSADVNYWGVTFASDDNRFYATVSTRGQTYLVEGDYVKWQARVLRSNVECPSLSPDGTKLAFKKRVDSSSSPWRLAVLDLATMQEHLTAEADGIDDQAAWLDNDTLLYAKSTGPGASDIWATPAAGLGSPRLLIADASSPSLSGAGAAG